MGTAEVVALVALKVGTWVVPSLLVSLVLLALWDHLDKGEGRHRR